MPELPEVETIRLGLQRLIVGKTVAVTTNFDSPKSFPNTLADVERFLLGAIVTAVRRRAKVLLIELSTDYTLMVHLKMTGQLVFLSSVDQRTTSRTRWGGGHPTDSLVGSLPDRSTRQRLEFTDGSQLFFNDQRKFGWMKLLPTIAVPEQPFMQKVGPEPLDDSFTSKEFILRIRRRNNTTIKAAILDQTVLAGVGNIYADESLWMTKIHPATRVGDISDKQLGELVENIKKVLSLSIEKGGSTDKNYVDAEGKKGSYLKFANVFRLEGQPCPRCGATIEKTKVAGRGTHTCPNCQMIQ